MDQAPSICETQMTEEDRREIARTCAANMAAHSFSTYAIIAALAEQGLVRQDRVASWVNTFADLFDQNPAHPENKDVAAHLRNFANNLKTLSTIPENAGRA